MEGVVVRLSMAIIDIFRVAWAPTPLEKKKKKAHTTYRAEKSQWIIEACLDNSDGLKCFPGWVFTDEG